jgi:hypothetical protein
LNHLGKSYQPVIAAEFASAWCCFQEEWFNLAEPTLGDTYPRPPVPRHHGNRWTDHAATPHGRAPISAMASITAGCNPLARTGCVAAPQSSSSSGTGQAMAITAAPRMIHRSWCGQSDQPDDHRSLVPRAYFGRRISRTCHVDNLSADTGLQLPESRKDDLGQLRSPSTRLASPYRQGGAFDRIGWALCVGTGVRISSDSAKPSTDAGNCRP